MDVSFEKYMCLLPESFSDFEKLRCTLFLASEQGRLWLTHYMLQLQYNQVTGDLSFSKDFIEDCLSHFIKVACMKKHTCMHDVSEALTDHCWIWCELWQGPDSFPCWVYGADKAAQTINVLGCTPSGLKQKDLPVNQFVEMLFRDVDIIELQLFSAEKPRAKFAPIFLQEKINLFLEGIDLSCLEKQTNNILWGLAALQACLQAPTFAKQNVCLLQEHLRFMKYRLQLWRKTFVCNTKELEDLICQLQTDLQKLEANYIPENKKLYYEDMKNYYKQLNQFIKETWICDCHLI